jgi:hypothetical protein
MILTGHGGLRPVELGQREPLAMRDATPRNSGQADGLAVFGATSTRSEQRSTPK